MLVRKVEGPGPAIDWQGACLNKPLPLYKRLSMPSHVGLDFVDSCGGVHLNRSLKAELGSTSKPTMKDLGAMAWNVEKNFMAFLFTER